MQELSELREEIHNIDKAVFMLKTLSEDNQQKIKQLRGLVNRKLGYDETEKLNKDNSFI